MKAKLHSTSPSMKELYKRKDYNWCGTRSGLFSRRANWKRRQQASVIA